MDLLLKEDHESIMELYLGEYSVNRSGKTGHKITIPTNVVDTWNLENKDKLHLYYDGESLIIRRTKLKVDN